MSETYTAISWNRQKLIYDAVIAAGAAIYLGVFIGLGVIFRPNATIETVIIRAFGTLAFVMLHVILIIGPLCRIWPKFLPLLYNRRHLGVATFLAAAVHGVFSIVQFHAFGKLNPLVSLLVSNTRYTSIPDFPFQILGAAALLILFLMAATSHDFWLNNLSAPVWKTLHMLVYVAYALLVGHVVLGVLQAERNPMLEISMGLGIVVVTGLHLIAAFREASIDRQPEDIGREFVEACVVEDIPEKRACIAIIGGERVAIFKYDGKVSVVSNVCQHQNGPLGEGEVIDGCITCPWHGFQYDPETGLSPPPYTEKVLTFPVRIENGRVLVGANANAAGTRAEPARVAKGEAAG